MNYTSTCKGVDPVVSQWVIYECNAVACNVLTVGDSDASGVTGETGDTHLVNSHSF